ncbi:urease accessory protein UreE [Flavisphingomonas formosensis]|uniref:urease accessory protein UreE n=1 Tax=Flavisphingomonas formosensis TaxID=861534 RepID=UPI0012FC8291|nr:urease accessory protein UreE [Sphingomonas formosensis]
MHRIVSIISGEAPGASAVLRLDHDMRTRRRIVFTTPTGEGILLDMPRPVRLRDGDGLKLEDGRIVRVEAADEALTEIHAHDLPALVRIAWHLGNRHLPTQLLGDRLRIRHDHVIEAMVHGLGGHCHAVLAPFDPEGGAYEDGGGQGHGHHHHHHDGDEGHHPHDHAHG